MPFGSTVAPVNMETFQNSCTGRVNENIRILFTLLPLSLIAQGFDPDLQQSIPLPEP